MESRSLQLTDSSEEENMPGGASNCQRRFLEPQEIREAFDTFRQFDVNGDNFIELSELKMALEKLSVPQTHLSAKQLMAEIAGPHSPKLSFCQFLFTYAAILQESTSNAIELNQSLVESVTPLESDNVSKEAVSNVKRFFEARVAQQSSEPNPNSANKEDSSKNTVLDI
ncbi:GH18108 [Drosophila grimshawi]|uniref:GH18108 n=2 Tax=Drosophila grimshawi TaxID=7222 RepID=B4JGZ4_DROGR|nr:GH18108 [Drosophila grimshawi]